MRNFLLFSAISTAAISAHAQTLTSADALPVIGTEFTVHTLPTMLDPGAEGSGVTWDYSTLTESGTVTYKYLDPSTSAHAAMFPTAQWAVTNSVTDTFFFASTASGHEKVGEDFLVAIYDVQCAMSNSELRLKLPLSYGDSWNDAIAASYQINGNPTTRGGGISGECDGSGTLNMPYGTVNGVVRIHTRLLQTDQISIFTGTHNRDEWVYMAPYMRFPLLRITADTINVPSLSSQIVNTTEWLDASEVGIDQETNELNFIVFPNPTADELSIYLGDRVFTDLDAMILDLGGRVVSTQRLSQRDSRAMLSLKDLATGSYTVTVRNSGKALGTVRVNKD